MFNSALSAPLFRLLARYPILHAHMVKNTMQCHTFNVTLSAHGPCMQCVQHWEKMSSMSYPEL